MVNQCGSGSLTLSGQSTIVGGVYSAPGGSLSGGNMGGSMVLTSGALVAGASSTGAPGSVTSGPFGKGAVNLSGGTLTSNASGYTIANQLYLGVSGSSVTLGDTNSYAMTLSGAAWLWQNMTLTTPGSGVTLAGAISDGGSGYGITKSGAGTLTLSGASTYTGATTISQGTLQLGDGSANNGSVSGNITDNATLTFANPNAQTYSGVISGTGALTKTAAGTVILSNANSYGGGTTISQGTLQLGDGSANNGSVSGNITDNATLAFANPNVQTYSGVISGNGE